MTLLLDQAQLFSIFAVVRLIILAVTIWGILVVYRAGSVDLGRGAWALALAFVTLALDNFMTALIGVLNGLAGQYREWYIEPFVEARIYISLVLAVGLYLIFSSWWPQRHELVRTRNKLERVLNDMRALMSASSHQIRSPLGTVQGYLALIEVELAEGTLDESTMQKYLSFMDVELKRLSELVDKFAEYVKLEAIQASKETLDLTAVLFEVKDSLGLDSARLTLPVNPLTLCADPLHMHALFENLITNGLKYNESGKPKVVIKYQGLMNGELAMIDVIDNGMGIDPAYLERAFGIFERLNKDDKIMGSGVGLAIVKRIIDAHDGEIIAKNNEAGGMTFRVYLPLDGAILHVRHKGLEGLAC